MAIGIGDNEAILTQAVRDLHGKWEGTGWEWRDKARDDFERRYLEELEALGKAAQRAMKAVDQLLREAIHDCS